MTLKTDVDHDRQGPLDREEGELPRKARVDLRAADEADEVHRLQKKVHRLEKKRKAARRASRPRGRRTRPASCGADGASHVPLATRRTDEPTPSGGSIGRKQTPPRCERHHPTMSTATVDQHDADSHDLIRVQGARVNNLKDVSVEIPKRRLTVFTGVSGSGKSSLVFGTIAAESQRMINETYSAFLQGFMPTLARPEVDLLEGLTTAIIVDQERMGANPRSTVGTATDANAMLRILFSRLGKPLHRSADRVLVQRPDAQGERGDEHREGGGRVEKNVVREAVYLGGMCPRCEGMGSVSDFDLTALYDESKSLNEGAPDGPRLQHGRLVRPDLRRASASTWTSRSGSSPRRRWTTSSTRSRPRSRSRASTSPTRA